MGLLLAGADMTAVDNVCVDIMGFAIDDIRHLTPVNDIEVVGEKVEDVRSDFKKPLKAIMRVNPFVIYLDELGMHHVHSFPLQGPVQAVGRV